MDRCAVGQMILPQYVDEVPALDARKEELAHDFLEVLYSLVWGVPIGAQPQQRRAGDPKVQLLKDLVPDLGDDFDNIHGASEQRFMLPAKGTGLA
jgi:hypothetical protein